MIFKPACLGANPLPEEELVKDKKGCMKIGPCGVGEKALYLNSFYIDRQFYVQVCDVRRVFKRVAMSKGGFTGKGIFASIPYLVVQLANGMEKQCNFKYEDQVDRMLEEVGRRFPDIKLVSRAGEERLKEREREKSLRKLPVLEKEAQAELERIRRAEEYLRRRPELADELSQSARRKRAFLNGSHSYKWVAVAILLFGAGSFLYGLYLFASHAGFAVYFTLFGLAAMFLFAGSHVRPTLMENRRSILRRAGDAGEAVERYVEAYGSEDGAGKEEFPVPAKYAHPIVLKRMAEAMEEGRAATAEAALLAVMDRLKELNRDVEVDEEEYNEVVAIKAIFLNEEYSL